MIAAHVQVYEINKSNNTFIHCTCMKYQVFGLHIMLVLRHTRFLFAVFLVFFLFSCIFIFYFL